MRKGIRVEMKMKEQRIIKRNGRSDEEEREKCWKEEQGRNREEEKWRGERGEDTDNTNTNMRKRLVGIDKIITRNVLKCTRQTLHTQRQADIQTDR